MRKFFEFLGLRRNIALLLVALVLAGTGERLWLGFAPKYLETLGAGVLIIGLFDGLQTFLGAVYAYPGGWLTDHLGQRRSLLLFNAFSLVGYVLVYLWQSWQALIVGVFLFLAWSAFSLPATFAVVATSLDKSKHTMGIGVQSMVRRIPMMIGPVIGGCPFAISSSSLSNVSTRKRQNQGASEYCVSFHGRSSREECTCRKSYRGTPHS